MEETYLVEIRPARTRWRIKEITTAIARGFGVENFQELHPHITLFGPFCRNDTTTNYQILDIVGSVAGKYGPIPFMLAGFEKREGMHGSVIAFSVCPSEELRRITADLVRALAPVTESLNVWDGMPEKKWYHVTVANGLSAFSADTIASALCIQKSNQQVPTAPGSFFSRCTARFSRILRTGRFSRSNPGSLPRDVLLDDAGLRITVMHNNDILGEYDLIRKCWIPEEEIGNPRAWQELMARYRRSAGFELPAGSREDAGPEKIFVISDLHLGHENIIRYCSRPFVHHDPAEMDAVLIRNWNACVRPGDRVIFLGDLLYGKPALPAEDYVKQLNGRITFVSGNHDNPGFSGSVPSCCMTFEDIPFLFIHDPADAPTGFSGWIIHGHHHNNDLRQFPFIDYENRTVNVSAEVVGYVPVDLREICRLVQSRSEQNTNDPLLLRYPHVKDPGQGSR